LPRHRPPTGPRIILPKPIGQRLSMGLGALQRMRATIAIVLEKATPSGKKRRLGSKYNAGWDQSMTPDILQGEP
jgi:hypothetical protein